MTKYREAVEARARREECRNAERIDNLVIAVLVAMIVGIIALVIVRNYFLPIENTRAYYEGYHGSRTVAERIVARMSRGECAAFATAIAKGQEVR